MNKKRNLTLSFGVLLLLVLLYASILWMNQNPKDKAPSFTLYSLPSESILQLTFQSPEGEITINRLGDQWVYAQDNAFPLNQNFVETMLQKTSALTAKRYVASGTEHFEIYGLSEPSNTIAVNFENQQKTIYLGNENSATGDYYFHLEDSADIYTIDASFAHLFSNRLLDMANREFLPSFHLSEITSFSLVREPASIYFENADSSWSVSHDKEVFEAADTALVNSALSNSFKLRFETMISYRPNEEDLSTYGLSSPTATFSISYQSKQAAQPNSFHLRIGKKDSSGLYYYAYADSGYGIYTIKSDLIEPFFALSPADFLTLNVAPIKAETLTGFTLISAEKTFAFTLTSTETDTIYTCNNQQISEADFNSLYYQIYSLTAEKRTLDVSDQLTKQPILTFIFEHKEAYGKPTTVEIIPYNQSYHAAKIDGNACLLINKQTSNRLLSLITGLPY